MPSILILALLAPLAVGDTSPVDLPTPHGRFIILDPHAATSLASRVNDDLASKQHVFPPPTPGFLLTNRVLVRTGQASALKHAAASLGAAAPKPLPGLPGWFVVTKPSVAGAIEAASALALDPRFIVELDLERPRSLRSPNDPLYPQQWHLHQASFPHAGANLEPAWALGHTGAGIVIGICESGFQTTHPDLAANFNPEASQPGGINDNHATSCAGVAAAVAGNGIGGVGAAYGAGLSSLLIGQASKTAAAFLFRNDLNDIKSNSWGPPDNGLLHDWSAVERDAIAQSIATGREGKGEVFVWAAGNGGPGDRVDYDPYAASRFTIAVGAIDADDDAAWYNERGASMLVVAHSSGQSPNPGITTTKNNSGYTSNFGGTSSAAPLAAGVIALVLEAAPDLTWRDVQHILVRSARPCDPSHPSWTTNAAGYAVSEAYGFGAIDAHAAVLLARTWSPVADELSADSGLISVDSPIPDNDPVGLTRAIVLQQALRAESVELILNVQTPFVGDLTITLTSPLGTVSVLSETRDDARDNLVDRVFTSVRHWDEPAAGTWTVTLADASPDDLAFWQDVRLIVHGTSDCAPDCERDGDLDVFDYLCFLGKFAAQDPYADCEGDGDWDVFDFLCFQSQYAAGCN